jgi:predicted nucleic acid-binding protein
VEFFKGTTLDFLEESLQAGKVLAPPLVVAELISGTFHPNQQVELVSFLGSLRLCEVDFPHWIRVGELRASLRKKGYSISTPDAHVAQCTLDAGAVLFSFDSIFKKVSRIVNLELVQ